MRQLPPSTPTENLDKQMNSLQVCKLVVIRVDTDAEEQTSVATVDDLVIAELTVS